MDTLHDTPVIPRQALTAYLPPPLLSGLEAHMSAAITAATLKASS